jgi:hypothetical protein
MSLWPKYELSIFLIQKRKLIFGFSFSTTPEPLQLQLVLQWLSK